MIATRDALLALIDAENYGFLTVYRKGYPLTIKVADVASHNGRTGGLAVFCTNQQVEWKSSAAYTATLDFGLELYIDGTGEGTESDRGGDNEDWLIGKAEAIRDLIMHDDNATLAAGTTHVQTPITIALGIIEGAVRVARMEVSYVKRVNRART